MSTMKLSVLMNAFVANDYNRLLTINWANYMRGSKPFESTFDDDNVYITLENDISAKDEDITQLKTWMNNKKSLVYLGSVSFGYNPSCYVSFRLGFKAAAKEVIDLDAITTLSQWNAIDWRKHKHANNILCRGISYFVANHRIAGINKQNVDRLYDISNQVGSFVSIFDRHSSNGIGMEATEAFHDYCDELDKATTPNMVVSDKGLFKTPFFVMGPDWDDFRPGSCFNGSSSEAFASFEEASRAAPRLMFDRIDADNLCEEEIEDMQFAVFQLVSLVKPKILDKSERPVLVEVSSEFKKRLDAAQPIVIEQTPALLLTTTQHEFEKQINFDSSMLQYAEPANDNTAQQASIAA